MKFLDYFKKNIDIIATQLDKDGKTFNFTMSDSNEFDIKEIKEFKGGKSGDRVSMIEIQKHNYVLKVFSEGNRDKMIMNTKEIEIQKEVMNLFEKEYNEQEYMLCPVLYCYGYIKEVEYNKDESNYDGFLRYIIMELVSPTYELYNYIEEKCNKDHILYDLNLDHILLQIFYFIGKIILGGLTHCDLHLKNILIIPHKLNLSFNEITNIDYEFLSDYSIKVIDFGLSEKNDISCSKIRKTTSSLNELIKKCKGDSKWLDLILGELGLLGLSNPDLNFLCNIIYIFSLIDKKFQKINIKNIKEQSNFIVNVKGEENKIKILSNILNILIKIF